LGVLAAAESGILKGRAGYLCASSMAHLKLAIILRVEKKEGIRSSLLPIILNYNFETESETFCDAARV